MIGCLLQGVSVLGGQRAGCRQLSLQRVDMRVVYAKLVVQVGAGHSARIAHKADNVALLNAGTLG